MGTGERNSYSLRELICSLVAEYDRRVLRRELHESFVGGESLGDVLQNLTLGSRGHQRDSGPLTGDTRIRGRVFVFKYISHLPLWELHRPDSLEEARSMLEEMVNPFEAGMVVLEGVRPRPYEVWCDYGDGSFKLFSKREQLTGDPFRAPKPRSIRVEWQ